MVVVAMVLVMLAVYMFWSAMPGRSTSTVVNTTNREKLELGYGYPSNTLLDELDWIVNPDRLNRNLKEFYDTTGAAPYIALVYRPDVTAQGSSAEWEYANDWYTENLPNEGYVLFMYFDPGDGTDGNGQLVVGDQASILMDAEAQQVFWDYMDNLWLQDIDEDTLFAQAFNKTAARIMQRQTTVNDVMKYVFIVVGVCAFIGGVILILSIRRRHEAARAEETERILSTPLGGSGSSGDTGSGDSLLDQYSNSDNNNT